jgi:hypothetical protein
MVRYTFSLTEKSAKLVPFRLIIPLYEKLTTYLAKKLTFATPGPDTPAMATMPRTGVPQRSCPYPLGGPLMDARTVEMLAAALGHEPHSDLLR